MEYIIRGTTPTFKINVKRDLTDGWDVYVTFDYVGGQITKKGNDLTITEEHIAVTLSQADTMLFPEGGAVKVQARATKDGVALATKRSPGATFMVEELLLEAEIPLEE